MKVAFTIVTINYISYAKTLGDSIKKHNPDHAFYICLLGNKRDLNPVVNLDGFFLIESNELDDVVAVDSMFLKYNQFELSCALKPYFAKHLLKDKSIKRLKYFDSDILIFNSFDPVIESDETSSIFLTPHFFKPVDPETGNDTNDIALLKSGIYNAGYFEINNSAVSILFLDWWQERLLTYCYSYKPPFENIFVDQSWLNFVPVYFKNTVLIDHLGYNTSFYNLHERIITKINGNYFLNKDIPLIFFHFTGYKYYRHENVSIYNSKYNYENTPFLRSICDTYRACLIENSVQITSPPIVDNKKKFSINLFVKKAANGVLRRLFKIKVVKVSSTQNNFHL